MAVEIEMLASTTSRWLLPTCKKVNSALEEMVASK